MYSINTFEYCYADKMVINSGKMIVTSIYELQLSVAAKANNEASNDFLVVIKSYESLP